MKLKKQIFQAIALLAITSVFAGCKDAESYSDLLRDEEKACNWWLADHKVCLEVPEDGNFEVGEDAPFYKMDADGYVYMQVVNPGDMSIGKPEPGDLVYFRFLRTNVKYMYEGMDPKPEGNGGANSAIIGPTSFVYASTTTSTSTSQYGSGIQLPLNYLGYYSEVNLLLKSYYGFSADQSKCMPYIINVKYFKAEY